MPVDQLEFVRLVGPLFICYLTAATAGQPGAFLPVLGAVLLYPSWYVADPEGALWPLWGWQLAAIALPHFIRAAWERR